MKAWLLNSFDGLDGLTLSESVSKPEPAAGEIRLRLSHAALNPADRFLAEKLYPARPSLPHILGRDGCGVVDAVGLGVSDLSVGERVLILRGDTGITKSGTFAEYVVIPAGEVARAPEDWSDAEAASAALAYETAHQALTQWGPLQPTTVIVSGITGGVGVASLHLAKAWGHKVVGLTRANAKHDRLKSMGCNLIVATDDETLRDQVKELTNGDGASLAIDTLGGAVFGRLIDSLGYGGCISVIGMLAGPVPKFNTAKLLFKRLRIGGVQVGDYKSDQAHKAWGEIVDALNNINVRPIVDRVFPMSKLVEAFHHLAEGPFGKVVLDVRN